MKFCWVTLAVKDMDESLEFYQEMVGLALQRRFNAGPMGEIAFLGDGQTKVELICNGSGEETVIGKDISLGFEVQSAEEKKAFLMSKGISLLSDILSPTPYIKFFFVSDPNGAKIQFVENVKA